MSEKRGKKVFNNNPFRFVVEGKYYYLCYRKNISLTDKETENKESKRKVVITQNRQSAYTIILPNQRNLIQ
jgi:hypothetical protein